MFLPDGSCFQLVGPQGFCFILFHKIYLSKYVVILGIDDQEDKLTNDLAIMNILTDKEDIYFCQEDSYFIMEDKLILSGGYFISHGV